MRRFLIRVGALAAKEVIHIRRDVATLYIGLGLPVVLLLLFGYGVRFDIDEVPIAVLDQDRTASSEDLVRSFVATGEFRLVAEVEDLDQAETLFRRGRAVAALVVPAGFERRLGRGEIARVQLVVDGADSNTATMALARAEAQALGANVRVAAQAGFQGQPTTVTRTWTRFNPEGRSALFLVPGLAAYVLAIVAVLLTALTVAREWERGSMEQLFATPVGRIEIVVGKLLPYLVLGSVAVLLVLTVGAWVFDVPIRGSLALLALDSFLFLLGMLGLGLLISVVTRNQMVATQAAGMASILPTLLLSDFMFPVENMPLVLQLLSKVLPATYYIEALRGIMLRGNGIGELWQETLFLAAFAGLTIAVSTARFRRRLA